MGSGHRPWPVTCNGGWQEGVFVFIQLFAAVILIEGFTWVTWYVRVRPNIQPAPAGEDDPDYVLSGGQFLGPKPSILSIAFAIILGFFSARIVGTPDPCSLMEVNKFSWRTFIGGLLLMYAILMGIDYVWAVSRKSTDGKLP